jgi:hypothetical protein
LLHWKPQTRRAAKALHLALEIRGKSLKAALYHHN